MLMEFLFNTIPDTYRVSLFPHYGQHRPAFNKMLIDVNSSLDQNCSPFNLNEHYLEHQLEIIRQIPSNAEKTYWLTIARLNELALLCAGNYADSGELQAAGDLLVNPRSILVHSRQSAQPTTKERHGALSEQFSFSGKSREETLEWLAKECFFEIKEQPLLPLLYGMLENSGCIRRDYLKFAAKRMKTIASVITLLAAWHLPDDMSLCERLRVAGECDKEFVSSNLCKFDDRTFRRLGNELHKTIINSNYQSEFLTR